MTLSSTTERSCKNLLLLSFVDHQDLTSVSSCENWTAEPGPRSSVRSLCGNSFVCPACLQNKEDCEGEDEEGGGEEERGAVPC